MRFLVCGLVLLAASASPAFAGDFGDLLLRGSAQPAADPPNYPRWAGMYGGGQVGADFGGVDFSGAPGGIDCQHHCATGRKLHQLPVTKCLSCRGLRQTGASVRRVCRL